MRDKFAPGMRVRCIDKGGHAQLMNNADYTVEAFRRAPGTGRLSQKYVYLVGVANELCPGRGFSDCRFRIVVEDWDEQEAAS